MNRYTFKAKRKDGQWVYGNLLEPTKMNVFSNINRNDKFCLIVESSFVNGGWVVVGGKHWVLRETLCQCTGLQDIDGKDIFENDIVSFMEDGDISVGITPLNIKGIIEYLEGSYVVSQENTNNKYIDLMSYTINPSFKIIGNKFDKEED